MTKIAVGMPNTGTYNTQTVISILSMLAPKDCSLHWHFISSCLVYDAREKIVEFAQREKCDYIVMFDADMVPPNDIIIKLYNLLTNDNYKAGIVTGMAFKRTPPFQPCFYTKLQYDMQQLRPYLESPVEWADSGIMKLEGMGMACCMMKTEIFDKIEKPYFFPLPNLGEDLTFCLKAKSKGINMYVDLSIDVGHLAIMPVTKEYFVNCYKEHKAKGKPNSMLFMNDPSMVKNEGEKCD